jgi:predicted nucleic acid-binding protein
MSRIFWDTNLFLYLFEQHPDFAGPTAALLRRMNERGDTLITSWMTVAEVQVRPHAVGDPAGATAFRQGILQAAEVVPFAEAASDAYVRVRSTTTVKGPDAIQLACAAAARVELFVTNDRRLTKLAIPGIHFITSLEGVPI